MSTYNLQLLDFPGNYDQGTLPFGPRAYIAIKASSSVKWCDKDGKNASDYTVISAKCNSMSDFRYQVKQLISELQTIEKQADKFFRKDMDKEKSMSSI